MDRVSRPQVRHRAAPGRDRDAAIYVKEPLKVFELDFEANLPIVRGCVRHGKHLVFPRPPRSTECARREFRPGGFPARVRPDQQAALDLRLREAADGPVIHAYGMKEGLDYTLFRPFNWIGSGLDNLNASKEGSSR